MAELSEQEERKLRQQMADRWDLADPDAMQLLVLPSLTRDSVVVRDARRQQLAANLRAVADELGKPRPKLESAPVVKPREANEAEESRLCAACQGDCCKGGGEHAFVTPTTLANYLAEHPRQSPAEAIEAYLDHVPAEAYEDSCIYHTTQGCALPRTMRSATCEKYCCLAIYTFRRMRPGAEKPIVAVSVGEGHEARGVVFGSAEDAEAQRAQRGEG